MCASQYSVEDMQLSVNSQITAELQVLELSSHVAEVGEHASSLAESLHGAISSGSGGLGSVVANSVETVAAACK